MPATQLSLEGFDFAFNPNADEALVRQVATADFVDQGESVLLIGGPATGKSHISRIIEQATRQRGLTTVELWLQPRVCMDDDLLAHEFGKNTTFRADLLTCDLLIVDEADKRVASLLFLTLLRQRSILRKSTVITSYATTWPREMSQKLVTNGTNSYLPSYFATESGDKEWVALLNPNGFDPRAFDAPEQRPHLLTVEALFAATGMHWHTVQTGDRSYREFLRSQRLL